MVGFIAALATSATAVEQSQLATEALQDDFRHLALVTVLVGVFAGLELALDINLGALLRVLLKAVLDYRGYLMLADVAISQRYF